MPTQNAMTPFTTDQLTAILTAAAPLGRKAHALFGTSDILSGTGHKEAAQSLVNLAFTARSGFEALVFLAVDGLPDDLALQVRQQKIEGEYATLLDQIISGCRPPGAILDALGEFLARPGQPLDHPGIPGSPGSLVAAEQPSFDQAGVDQERNVLGENVGVHALDPEQPSTASGCQNHLAD